MWHRILKKFVESRRMTMILCGLWKRAARQTRGSEYLGHNPILSKHIRAPALPCIGKVGTLWHCVCCSCLWWSVGLLGGCTHTLCYSWAPCTSWLAKHMHNVHQGWQCCALCMHLLKWEGKHCGLDNTFQPSPYHHTYTQAMHTATPYLNHTTSMSSQLHCQDPDYVFKPTISLSNTL